VPGSFTIRNNSRTATQIFMKPDNAYCHEKGATLDGVSDWILDLLTTLTHNLYLHLIIALLLIITLYKSLEHTTKSFPAHCVFTSSCLVTSSNNGYSSASGIKTSVNGSSLTPYSQPYCNDLLVFSSPPDYQLSTLATSTEHFGNSK
jgi:hypothetical protein